VRLSLTRRRLVVLAALLAVTLYAGSGLVLAGVARLTTHWSVLEREPRVWYEPGARPLAAAVANRREDALRRVERFHGTPVPGPVVVSVFADRASFARYSMGPGEARAVTGWGEVCVAPGWRRSRERSRPRWRTS
jgi:hypothetical protein